MTVTSSTFCCPALGEDDRIICDVNRDGLRCLYERTNVCARSCGRRYQCPKDLSVLCAVADLCTPAERLVASPLGLEALRSSDSSCILERLIEERHHHHCCCSPDIFMHDIK